MLKSFNQPQILEINELPKHAELDEKVQAGLVEHVYSESHVATFASVFCAWIIFAGLHISGADNVRLISWMLVFLLIAFIRLLIVMMYYRQTRTSTTHWKHLFAITYTLSGASWGLTALILLPAINSSEQLLLVLMVAGVTAGAVPLASAIPLSCIGFLSACILPYIFSIAFLQPNIPELFNFTLGLYYLYMISITFRNYHLVRDTIMLNFQNDTLLNNLQAAKRELEKINHKLVVYATHDPLTKVANRTLFHSNLEVAISDLLTGKGSLALLYIDIDRFKKINDTYGHEAGDKLLFAVSDRLRHYLRNSDIIARMGGDEFTVILQGVLNQQHIEKMANELCRLINMPVEIGEFQIQATASMGISLYPQDADNAEDLIRHADAAMYQAKSSGGNQFSFFKKNSVHDIA